MEPKIYHLHTLSPLHCGTGQSISVVDLPIARDGATHLPMVPGSSMRGVLRNHVTDTQSEAENSEIVKTLFGPLNVASSSDSFAGALSVGDAHLLVLPVRAMEGIIAYITCPFVLKRYRRDLSKDIPVPEANTECALHAENNKNSLANKILLEDLDLDAELSNDATQWSQVIANVFLPNDDHAQTDFKQRFLILSDTVFAYLAETGTEIRTRIRIEPDTGVVKKGALWTEENLPSETMLWGVYALSDSRNDNSTATATELAELIPKQQLLQLGGNTGTGHGLVSFLSEGA